VEEEVKLKKTRIMELKLKLTDSETQRTNEVSLNVYKYTFKHICTHTEDTRVHNTIIIFIIYLFILILLLHICFTICTHTTSLTFDLTSGKTPQKCKKPFHGKKIRTLQESNRGGFLSGMDRRIDDVI